MAFNFKVQEAKREQIYTKIALMGASGAGKSYSALRLATGMVNELKERNMLEGTNGKILYANTEGPRGRYYASDYKYDIVDLEPPYNPELFTDLVNYAVSSKYTVLIIDSASAEWEGKGGCLELQQQYGGTYQSWSKVSPRHQKFTDAVAVSPIHIISCARSKDQYEVDKDDRGKVSVKKLGVGARQRDGFEYDFTCTFFIDRDSHMAKCEKDNTHIFEKIGNTILDESHGAQIIDWANSSDEKSSYTSSFVTSDATKPSASASDDSSSSAVEVVYFIDQISNLIDKLKAAGVDRMDIAKAIGAHNVINGKANPNYRAITDGKIAQDVIAELEKLA